MKITLTLTNFKKKYQNMKKPQKKKTVLFLKRIKKKKYNLEKN